MSPVSHVEGIGTLIERSFAFAAFLELREAVRVDGMSLFVPFLRNDFLVFGIVECLLVRFVQLSNGTFRDSFWDVV
jgi:hypothetical protein